jgi:hypothetical protein
MSVAALSLTRTVCVTTDSELYLTSKFHNWQAAAFEPAGGIT